MGSHRRGIEDAGWKWVELDISRYAGSTTIGDAHKLPSAGESFQFAFTNQELEHLANPFVVAEDTHGVLGPGGLFIWWRFSP